MRRALIFFAFLILLPVLAGCVTEVVERKPLTRATLVVTKSDNVATLQWQTQPGVVYAVMQSNSRGAGAVWQPLPGAARVTGDGGLANLVDTAPPGVDRQYRLQVLSAPRTK